MRTLVVLAVLAVFPAVASASTVSPQSLGRASAAGSELRLSQAPAGLRAAVRRALGVSCASCGGAFQQAKLTAPHPTPGGEFGVSVAIDGSTAVVGAQGTKSFTGAAYVFVRSGRTWSEQAELTASDGAPYDHFGISVATDGSTVVVGAYGNNTVYVFVRSGTAWSQRAELTASDGTPADEFGTSVAIAGSTAVVGALGKNSFTGAAYVFVRSGAAWSQQAELTASDGAPGDEFGTSVAVAGSTAVVGAPYGNSFTGAAYVFVRSGTAWSPQAELTDADGAGGDLFGISVAIAGSTAVVGAPSENSATGAAYVFVRSGTAWSQQAELRPARAGDDLAGISVAIAGSTAVVGAPEQNSATGAAYVFVRSGTAWSQKAELTASDGAPGDVLGNWVAIAGSTVVVGAESASLDGPGAAYVFALRR